MFTPVHVIIITFLSMLPVHKPPGDATVNVSVGGGVELPSHYPQWKVEYYKMESPGVLQTSLNKLVEGRPCS